MRFGSFQLPSRPAPANGLALAAAIELDEAHGHLVRAARLLDDLDEDEARRRALMGDACAEDALSLLTVNNDEGEDE